LNSDFTGVAFDGGDFTGAEFSGSKVSFGGAVFSGGTVDFRLSSDWSLPPVFSWTGKPPCDHNRTALTEAVLPLRIGTGSGGIALLLLQLVNVLKGRERCSERCLFRGGQLITLSDSRQYPPTPPRRPKRLGDLGGLLNVITGVLAGVSSVYLATRSVTVTAIACFAATMLASLLVIVSR
jgi:hypothetical protein